MSEKDTIYRDDALQPDRFRFDDRVVRVFPDMIRRSVPGYGLIVPSIALLARRHVQAGSRIYDLGCSLGAVSFAILDGLGFEEAELIAVDNSAEMVEAFRRLLDEHATGGGRRMPVHVERADVLELAIENASVVVLNFTLQFIDPEQRDGLLQRIAEGMRPGGLLVLSEKVVFGDAGEQDRQSGWHLDFKRAQGYSDLEISRKRDALEQTLRPESMEMHLDRLRRAGFAEAYCWFRCFNFASIAAIR